MVNQIPRREALKLFSGVASTAFIAGCSGTNSSDSGTDDTTSDEDNNESSSGNNSGGDNSSNDNSSDDTGSGDNDSDENSSGNNSVDPAQWEGVETIRLQSDGTVWRGAEPEMIADQENPTLVLYEGNQYEFIYENGDGGYHNLELWDENGDVVNDYSTEIVRENGAERTLTVEATPEIVKYVCNPHSSSMNGEIRIE